MSRSRVAIVGSGLVGVCCAYYAASSGHEVQVFDRGEVGMGTTAASGSAVLRQTKQSSILLELTGESMHLYDALLADLGAPYRVHGSHVLFKTREEEDLVRRQADWLQKRGVRVNLLGQSELRRKIPDAAKSVVGSSFAPDDAEVSPYEACLTIARGAARLGAAFHLRTPVLGFDVAGDRIRGVVTPGATQPCDQVVVAAGTWTPMLLAPLGLSVPVEPQKGELLHTWPVTPRLQGRILGASYLLSKLGRSADIFTVGMVVGQEPDGSIKMGSTRERAGFALGTTDRARQAVLDEVRQYLPALADLPIQRQTAGLRPYSALKRPIVGRIAWPQGLVLACGHGGDGVALAPITGWFVAQILSGSATGFDSALAFKQGAEAVD